MHSFFLFVHLSIAATLPLNAQGKDVISSLVDFIEPIVLIKMKGLYAETYYCTSPGGHWLCMFWIARNQISLS